MLWWPYAFLLLALSGLYARAAQGADIVNGVLIYREICAQCHGPDPRQNTNNITQAANNPLLVEQQIATNPDMQFLKSILTMNDIVDVTTYINTVVNPGSGPPALDISPPWIMFPAQTVGSTHPGLQLTLVNKGTSNLSLNSLTLAPADFGLLSGCSTVVAPDAFCQITITFTPHSAGVVNGTLAIATNSANSPRMVPVSGTGWDGVAAAVAPGTVVEYYNPDLDEFFITADATEQASVDSGVVGQWRRTRLTFKSGGSTQVCRFFGNALVNSATGAIYGPNSHFYTGIQPECDFLKGLFQANAPSWKFESLDFQTAPQNPDGTCPPGTAAVLRAYNNGSVRGVDSNHRITTSPEAIAEVVAHGWKNEGVVMCAPQ